MFSLGHPPRPNFGKSGLLIGAQLITWLIKHSFPHLDTQPALEAADTVQQKQEITGPGLNCVEEPGGL